MEKIKQNPKEFALDITILSLLYLTYELTKVISL